MLPTVKGCKAELKSSGGFFSSSYVGEEGELMWNWKDYSVKFNRHNEQYQEHAYIHGRDISNQRMGAGAEGQGQLR